MRDGSPQALPWPPNPLLTPWGAGMAFLTALSVAYLLCGCSGAVPVPELPTLPPGPACKVMATQPFWGMTDPDLVNLGDLKALVARFKACNSQTAQDGGL